MQQGKERARVKRGYFAAVRLPCSLRSGRAELPVIFISASITCSDAGQDTEVDVPPFCESLSKY